jgi:hypothetical protein
MGSAAGGPVDLLAAPFDKNYIGRQSLKRKKFQSKGLQLKFVRHSRTR